MGNEALCRVEIGGEAADAKALLETEELIVRGALRAKIPFREVKDVVADGGVLRLRWNDRDVRIHVGRDAAKWAEKIRNPKSVADKLGVKRGQKICVIGKIDDGFLDGIDAADVSRRLRKGSDIIFYAANRREDLARLEELRGALAPAGAIWVIRPKGGADYRERRHGRGQDRRARRRQSGAVFGDSHRRKARHPARQTAVTETSQHL
jgi:bifunctional DNA-binding transcriptional regulator/antitoxin component of YhaV-PrlF toxin-antitoxin module